MRASYAATGGRTTPKGPQGQKRPDDADLWEIDENFARSELSDAQRADHHKRRKAILEGRGTVLKRGGDRKSNSQDGSLKGYAKQSAESLGIDERTVQRDRAVVAVRLARSR